MMSGGGGGGGGMPNPADLRAIREAAVAAAQSQKTMLTAKQGDLTAKHEAAKVGAHGASTQPIR